MTVDILIPLLMITWEAKCTFITSLSCDTIYCQWLRVYFLFISDQPNELLYFADICAGPGGFSEYVLWRKKWRSKGFGLTLKSGPGVNDFKLDEFFTSPSECFEPHYGVG